MTSMSWPHLLEWRDLVVRIALDAGDELLRHFEGHLHLETKTNAFDLVTVADRASEALIVERLRAAFPRHAILAEESGASGTEGGPVWFVDPLDGTTNFAHRFPHFSVVIALYDGDDGLLGVVHDPLRAETFVAAAGHGAWLTSPRYETVRLQVGSTTTLQESLVATGFGPTRDRNIVEFTSLLPQVRDIRRPGSAALDLAYVAAGRLNGYWEYNLKPWDWGAGALLVREAGGVVQRRDGHSWVPGDATMVAANPSLAVPLRNALWPTSHNDSSSPARKA